jgi:hypothetical protein
MDDHIQWMELFHRPRNLSVFRDIDGEHPIGKLSFKIDPVEVMRVPERIPQDGADQPIDACDQ